MSGSNCCFLTCIQFSQEAGQVVWYSHLFQNFPQCIVIHTIKGFGVVNTAEIESATNWLFHLPLQASQVVLVVKKSLANAGDVRDLDLIPGLWRSPGEGNGYPLQYSCWRIPWSEESGVLQSVGLNRGGHVWSSLASMHTSTFTRIKSCATAPADLQYLPKGVQDGEQKWSTLSSRQGKNCQDKSSDS